MGFILFHLIRKANMVHIFPLILSFGRPGTLSIQTSRQAARNHSYRCRGHQGNKTVVNQRDCSFLMPSHPVTDV